MQATVLSKPNAENKYLKGTDAINLFRIRMGLSGLKHQRRRYHMIQISTCDNCGNANEDEVHFPLNCPAYVNAKNKMVKNVTALLTPNVHGSNSKH